MGPVAEAAGSAPEIFPRALLPRATECTDVRVINIKVELQNAKKKIKRKTKLSKLDGYFFRPTPPPAGDEPEVVATASRVSSPSPSPPTTLVGVGYNHGHTLSTRKCEFVVNVDIIWLLLLRVARPPSLFPFLSLGCSDDDNRDDSAAASCSSRGEPGLTLDQPHPSPSGLNCCAARSPPHATPTGETQTTDHDVSCNYPLERFTTDRANYLENIEDANIKRYILKMGPCKPKGPFPKDKDNLYEQWKTNGTIDADMERNVRNAAQFWRQVVERIVNVTLTLASSNLAFRGHREVLGQGKAGNFLSIIELLARYDPVLKELINRPEGSVKYLSHQIQDEIIYILSQRVKADIIDEINEAPFYSVIMDTTQDVSKIDQLSQVYRYITVVKNDMDIATDIQINEVFLGFELMTPESRTITLKRLCPTRWSSRHDALVALRHRYGDITKALVKISLTSDKKDERNEASALKNAISKFRFLFLVNMQTKILESIHCASQLLQAKDADILKASTLLQNAISVLVEYRGQFDEAKSATLALATKWGSQTQFETTRARKVKRHFDELSEDSRLTDAESNFRVTVFNACLDIIIQQLSQRFTSLNATVNMFEAIHPNTLLQAKDEDLHQAAQRLIEHYSRDIAASFPGQLLSFRTCFRDQIQKLKS
ncbi:hypothetical protein F7725_007662, partial [Dissostichus mawsoni]